jgi:hypothetical protein
MGDSIVSETHPDAYLDNKAYLYLLIAERRIILDNTALMCGLKLSETKILM